ncbi:MAG: DUF4213 domain-containing proteins [Thermodesulfobacteriota bacterium]|nr:DUF4213 domain-containing proteins [Thermodesulfobacteriota bacterium]
MDKTLSLLKSRYEQENREPGMLLKIGIKPQWNVVIATDQLCGVATNFTGKHELYGKPEKPLEAFQSLIGMDLLTIADRALNSSDLFLRSLGHAALSALSQPLLNPARLQRQHLTMSVWADFKKDVPQAGELKKLSIADLVNRDDVVAVVGYGGMVRRLIGRCKELHVTEIREKEAFKTVIISDTVTYGP